MSDFFSIFKAFADGLRGDISATSANLLTSVDPTATPTGTTADATSAGAAILAKIGGGYTLQTFTASNGSWPVPSALATAGEVYVGVIGGGGKGAAGAANGNAGSVTLAGGAGGLSGGLIVEKTIGAAFGATAAITIGAGATSNGTNGGITSIDSLAVSSPGGVGAASIAVYIETTSAPGNGGNGGSVLAGTSGNNGVAGTTNAKAVGGNFGTGTSGTGSGSGNPGTAGGTGITSSTPIVGGAGGGGGGGRYSSAFGSAPTGGAGGAGGYPGGGSGGGGAAASQNAGSSATGGNGGTAPAGFAFILWKA